MRNLRLIKALREKIGTITAVACPDCGAMMVIRQNKDDLSFFLGCHRYPACKHTAEIPESMQLELLGYPKLPGLE